MPTPTQIKPHVELAYLSSSGCCFLVGWLFDPSQQVVAVLSGDYSKGWRKKQAGVTRIDVVQSPSDCWVRTRRPDVSATMGGSAEGDHQHGFVLKINDFDPRNKLAFELQGGQRLPINYELVQNIDAIRAPLAQVLPHSGRPLYTMASSGGAIDAELAGLLKALLCGEEEAFETPVHVDYALNIDGQLLLVAGWIAERPGSETAITLHGVKVDQGACSLSRYYRPDLKAGFSYLGDVPQGFLLTLPIADLSAVDQLSVTNRHGQTKVLPLSIQSVSWADLGGLFVGQADLLSALLDDFTTRLETGPLNALVAHEIKRFCNSCFKALCPVLSTMVNLEVGFVGTIDRAYPLGADGVLLFGWMINQTRQALKLELLGPAGAVEDLSATTSPLIREDVAAAYRQRFPAITSQVGFVAYVPLATHPGDPLALRVGFPLGGSALLRVPTETHCVPSIDLIKQVLGMIPAPERMNHSLYQLFERGLGTAIESINTQRPRFEGEVVVQQYGTAPADPATTIIVPLYGRCDFMRYQLAEFANDSELKQADILYVVDDPRLVDEVHGLAAKYAWLFGVPFRVLTYGTNLGFAGANNLAARYARGKSLLLLNSDVFPQHPGWLSTLQTALEQLPDCGAVGPLLQFADNTIQHAGMYPLRGLWLPGFLLNTHKNKGMYWEDSDEPTEHPMLTGACLLMRTKDYRELGGFDEGYVVGDFEDSDLCLALSKRGKKLYLVPAAKLWHLERQSQTLDNVAGVRQLITLFNGWRYQQKIKQGVLSNPEQLECYSGLVERVQQSQER